MNDVFNLWSKLFGKNDTAAIEFYGGISEVNICKAFFEEGVKGGTDNPDAYISLEDELLILEHFRIDCSKKTKNGSLSLEEQARTDREYKQMLSSKDKNSYVGSINAFTSYQNYITNAICTFDKHYSRIDEYIRNVEAQEKHLTYKKIRVCFMIEDVSIAPPTVMINNDMTIVILTRCDEFLHHFSQNKSVDWLLFIPSGYNQYPTKGYFCSQKDINVYIKKAIPYAKYKFIPWEPKVVGGKITLPSDNGLSE
jgi:hypothetical protein